MDTKKLFVTTMILSAAAAAGIFFLYGITRQSVLFSVAAAVLIAIAIEDALTKEIHDVFLILLFVIGAVLPAENTDALVRHIAGVVALSMPLACVSCISKKILGTESIGAGDIILCGGAGLILGPEKVLIAGAEAFIAAGIYAAAILILGRARKDDTFALGPFLCAAFIVGLFF